MGDAGESSARGRGSGAEREGAPLLRAARSSGAAGDGGAATAAHGRRALEFSPPASRGPVHARGPGAPGFDRRTTVAILMLCLVGAVVSADQNLLAPNLTQARPDPARGDRRRGREAAARPDGRPAPPRPSGAPPGSPARAPAPSPQVARDLGMTDGERDALLAGATSAAFFAVGAPASLAAGLLDPHVDRVWALAAVLLVGEGPLLLAGLVTRFWQLFVLRVLTGVAVGASLPFVFSVLSDLFPPSRRNAVSSLAMVASGVGLGVGQGAAGFLGPTVGWRLPFVGVGACAVALAALLVLTVRDPPRGAMDGAAGARAAPAAAAGGCRGGAARLGRALRIGSNAVVFLQGVPGSLPWGMIMVFLNDYLAQDQGLGVRRATGVLLAFGVASGVGTVAAGAAGQWLYNRREELMVLFAAGAVLLGVAPVLYLVAADLSGAPLAGPVVAAAAAGALVVVAGPNIRAATMNVNAPDTLGIALAMHATLDDVGKGLGPALVAPLVAALGRRGAFVAATLGWVPCAAVLSCLLCTLRRDERRKRAAMEGPAGGGDKRAGGEAA